jgi:hypothetical protein
MKKHIANGKKAAAHDVETHEAPKAAKKGKAEKSDERYTISQTDTVKRGLLKEFCDFVRKKGIVTVEQLVSEFAGRTIDKHPTSAARVHKYVRYSLNHGHIKPVKNGGTTK